MEIIPREYFERMTMVQLRAFAKQQNWKRIYVWKSKRDLVEYIYVNARIAHIEQPHDIVNEVANMQIAADAPNAAEPAEDPRLLNSSICVTFGEQVENHHGMEMIGQLAEKGLSLDDLNRCMLYFNTLGKVTELHHLADPLVPPQFSDGAYVLIIRNAADPRLWNELIDLPVDTRVFMYGRVVNKHARHNLCFADFDQEPNYEAGKGRIISFAHLPILQAMRELIGESTGINNLLAEENYYYDITKCGVGYHGDLERRIVVAIRLGASLPICYQWHLRNQSIGERKMFMLNHCDIYFMSDKAVGFDWKKSSIYTLRHAAGSRKFIDL